MPDGQYYIRIGVKDLDKAKAAINSFGGSVDASFVQVQKSAEKPTRAMAALNQAARGLGNELQYMASRAGPAGDALAVLGTGGLAAAAAIGAVTGALVIGIRKTSEALQVYGAMTDQADQLGLSFERFQELTFGFGDVGVDADKTTRALTKLNDALGEILIRGDKAPKELIVAFDALGISIEDIQRSGGDMDEMLGRIADGLRNLGTTQEQTSAFTAIFGQRMAALIPIFLKGSEGLDDMAKRARDAGAVISNDLGAAMDRVADRTEQLNTIIRAQETQFLTPFIENWNLLREAYVDVLTSINQLTDAFPEMNQFITSQLTIVGTLAEAWREAKTAYDKFFPDRSFYYNRPGAAGELLAERQAAAGAYGPQLPPPAQDRGLVIEINEPNSVTPGRPPIKPYDIAEWRRQLDAFNAPIEDKTARKASALNAPIPKPRPLPYSYADADPLSYGTAGALGGGFDQMPTFELGEYDKFWLEFDQKGKETYDNLTMYDDAFRNAALTTAGTISATFGDALAELALTGKVSTEALIESFASMIIKQLTALAVQLALNAAMAAMTGGASTAGGGVGALVGIGAGLAFGAGGAGSGGQYNQSSQSGTAPVFAFHGGGVAGFGSPALRYVHPAVFDAAPRLHNGGFAGNEVPAVLTRGEGVFTPEQMKAMGGIEQKITINNYAGADVRTSQDENGNLQVDIMKMVDSAMTANASRPNSQFSQYMNSRGRVIPR